MNFILLRKELRQLSPLLIAVLLFGLLGYGLIEMRPTSWYNQWMSSGYVLLALPALFAVGAGAMSVSQEKETRTLGWLTSLPLATNRLIKTKFIAAAICWAVLWLVTTMSFITIEAFGIHSFPYHDKMTHPIHSIWVVYWALNSFYLLVCGFLTAWRFGSSMTALIAFIPLAITPTILRYAFAFAQDPFHAFNSSLYDPTLAQCLMVICCSLAIAFWLMNRVASQSLAPLQTPINRNPYTASQPAIDTTIQTSRSVLSPCSAMLWQFYHQNKVFYHSLCGASLIVGLVSVTMATTLENRNGGWEGFAGLTIFVAAAWMGVLVFQGDNLQERIRFLAERGVTPLKAWCTRQLLPFAFVCLASLFYLLFLARYYSSHPENQQLPLWFVFWFLAVSFGYAQWVAQLVRNPVLSALGSPIAAGMAMFYTIYAYVELSSLLLCMVVFSLAPFIATLLMMRRWMDRRFEWPFWCGHAAIVLLAVVLPIGDLAWYVWNAPSMPNDVKLALRKEGREIGQSPWDNVNSLENLIPNDIYGFGEMTIERRVAVADQRRNIDELNRLFLLRMKTSNTQAIRLNKRELDEPVSRLLLSRTRLEQNPDDPSALKDYQGRMEFIWMLATSLRRSVNLWAQETADYAEISLIAELQQPNAKANLSKDAWERYITLVADPIARNASRRRAIVACWFEYDQEDHSKIYDRMGEFQLEWSDGIRSQTKELKTRTGRLDHLAWVLLQFLETGPNASDETKLEFLRRRWPTDSNTTNSNYSTQPARINNPRQFEWCFISPVLPGDQWFAGWEQVGAELQTSEQK